MSALATETIQEPRVRTVSKRLKGRDPRSIEKYLNGKGNFIWALAQKFTATHEEAEAAAREIFIDIWRFAERGNNGRTAETMLSSLIARRHLLRYLQ